MTTTWKQTERAIARRLEGQRIGCTGQATPDVVTDSLSIEVKHRDQLPQWLMAAMAQAVTNAPAGKLPVLILHQSGQRHGNDLVVLRLADFGR